MVLLLYLCKISQLLSRHIIYALCLKNEPSTPQRINLENLGIAVTIPLIILMVKPLKVWTKAAEEL